MRHFSDARPDLVIHVVDVNSPCIGELRAHGGVGHILIAGEHIWQHAHIARTLDVVLSANRADTHGRAAKIAGQ
ncbi:hypothetical protein D3C76_1072540 [compost metagenome]